MLANLICRFLGHAWRRPHKNESVPVDSRVLQSLQRDSSGQEAQGQGVSKATAAETRYMGRVASIGCVLCKMLAMPQEGRTFVHHIKAGTGIGERSEHWLTVALCHEHHQGAGGIHGLGTKGFYLRYRMDELELLALTICALSLAQESSELTERAELARSTAP